MTARHVDADSTPIRAFKTEQAVYGTILVAALIWATDADDETAWSDLATVGLTVVVFWAAHVYAGTVAGLGTRHSRVSTTGQAFRRAVREASGMLVAAVLPLFCMLLAATDVFPGETGAYVALWSCVLVLGVLGYQAFQDRGARPLARVGGAALTASFGLVIILLNAFVH